MQHPSATAAESVKDATLARELTAIILDEPQIRELCAHVTHNAVQRTSPWPELTGQLLLEGCLTWGQPGRRVAGM